MSQNEKSRSRPLKLILMLALIAFLVIVLYDKTINVFEYKDF